MYQDPYQPQQKKSLAPLFLTCGGLFIAGVIGIVALGVTFFKVATTGVTGVRKVSDAFVQSYATGNGQAAFGLMCPTEQAATTPARLTSTAKFLISQNGPMTGTPTMTNWGMNNFNGVSYATIDYQVPYRNKPSPMRVVLIKNRTWQVQTYNVQLQ